jgi:hypothetical protein
MTQKQAHAIDLKQLHAEIAHIQVLVAAEYEETRSGDLGNVDDAGDAAQVLQ